MTVVVTGGRAYANAARVRQILAALSPRPTLLIHGGQTGADTLAGEAAAGLGIPVEVVAADWERFGRAAGPLRNAAMISRKPDLVVAFPGGKGTANAVRCAQLSSVPVFEVTDEV